MYVDPTEGLPPATAAEYLAALTDQPDLQANPDARLKLFRSACQALERADHSSDAGKRASNESHDGDSLADWFAVLLRGAQDAWSAVRHVCLDGIDAVVTRAVEADRQDTLDAEDTDTTPVKERQTTRVNPIITEDTETGEAAALCSAFATTANELLTQMRAAWAAAGAWYVREGLLRVCETLLRDRSNGHNGDSIDNVRHESNSKHHYVAVLRPWCSKLLRDVAVPSLADPQLPVRKHAVAVLCAITRVDHSLVGRVADDVMAELETLSSGHAEPPMVWTEAQTRRAEGHLLAVVEFCTPATASRDVIMKPEETRLYRVLSYFAAHPASSVRQYVAEAFGQQSDCLFVALLEHLLAITDPTAGLASVPWQTKETLLMALQHHLGRYLSAGPTTNTTTKAASTLTATTSAEDKVDLDALVEKYATGLAVRATSSPGPAPPHASGISSSSSSSSAVWRLEEKATTGRAATSPSSITAASPAGQLLQRVLAVVVACAASARFEVARMGRQVVPLLLQYWVRFAAGAAGVHAVMRTVCTLEIVVDHDNGDSSSSDNTGAASSARRQQDDNDEAEGKAAARRAAVMEGLVAPALWWYVAIRAVTERAPHRGEPMTLTVPETVTGLWRVWLKSASGTTSENESADVAHHFAVRLAIASYFRPEMFPHDHGFYEAAAAPLRAAAVWQAVLQNPKSAAAERLPWGLDFVHAPICRAVGPVQAELVPAWLAALPSMLTHQQCVLLCMARAVISAHGNSNGGNSAGHVSGISTSADSSGYSDRRASANVSLSGLFPSPVSHRPFGFVFHQSLFGGPATLDGGEDLMLGHTWLRAYFPAEEYLPEPLEGSEGRHLVTENVTAGPTGSASSDAATAEAAAAHAVLAAGTGFRHIYAPKEASAVVEPVVLREARALLLSVARQNGGQWAADALAVVVARLDAVLPARWWEAGVKEGGLQNAAASAAGASGERGGWDDWDDDSDAVEDENGAVEGIAPDEEIRDAASMARLLSRRLWCGGGGGRSAVTAVNKDIADLDAKAAFLLCQ